MEKSSLITVFGATGYTGRRIAHVLDREGLDYRLAGRSSEKLAKMASGLSARPGWLVADATQPGSLTPLFQGNRVLINCAGPFTDLGERVIAQAAMSGASYLDTTNELGFVYRARSYSQMAARTHSTLVPSCAFEVALADCAAHLVSQELLKSNPNDPLDCIDVVYALDGKTASVGTRRSAIRSLATSWIAYRNGTWTGQIPGGKMRRFHLPGGSRDTYLIPSSESITLPLHVAVRHIDVWMAAAPGARFWVPVAIPLLARLSRSILRPIIVNLAASGGVSAEEAPGADRWSPSPFTILVTARQGHKSRWMTLSGNDPYSLTAEIAVFAARRLADESHASGLLAPAQVLEPAAFLDHARQKWGLAIREGEGQEV